MLTLKAMPGRVVLKFESPKAQIGSIIIPEMSQMRPEFPTIYDVGAAIGTEESQRMFELLTEMKENGDRVCVHFASGTMFWKAEYDQKAWGWLKDYRVFTFDQMAAFLWAEAD